MCGTPELGKKKKKAERDKGGKEGRKGRRRGGREGGGRKMGMVWFVTKLKKTQTIDFFPPKHTPKKLWTNEQYHPRTKLGAVGSAGVQEAVDHRSGVG